MGERLDVGLVEEANHDSWSVMVDIANDRSQSSGTEVPFTTVTPPQTDAQTFRFPTLPEPPTREESSYVENLGQGLGLAGLALTVSGVVLTKLTKDNMFFIGPVVGAPAAAFGGVYHTLGKVFNR